MVSFRPWSRPLGVAAPPAGAAPVFGLYSGLSSTDLSTFCTRISQPGVSVQFPQEGAEVRLGTPRGGQRGGRVRVDADALRRLRESRPLTVRELAEVSGVSHNTITTIENRHRTANPSTVRKLAASLGVEPGELMMKGDG